LCFMVKPYSHRNIHQCHHGFNLTDQGYSACFRLASFRQIECGRNASDCVLVRHQMQNIGH
jgi:hypothetical protein